MLGRNRKIKISQFLGLKRKGVNMDAKEKEQISLRLPAQLKEELVKEAYKYGYSFNEYLLILIHKGRQN